MTLTHGGSGSARTRLRDLAPQQWRAGGAAVLGVLCGGFDAQLTLLAAAPVFAAFAGSPAGTTSAALVGKESAIVLAAALTGGAVGAVLFGRTADQRGRSRALRLAILTCAAFTGLAFLARSWWEAALFCFLAALGVGGGGAAGATLLAETWPKSWRPWLAAALQTGANVGVLLAVAAAALLRAVPLRGLLLAGALPALLIYWIRRSVPEPAPWRSELRQTRGLTPGFRELWRGRWRRITFLGTAVCALSLAGWWVVLFWQLRSILHAPEGSALTGGARPELVLAAFFRVIAAMVAGNFAAAWLARRTGYRAAIVLLLAGLAATVGVGLGINFDWPTLTWVWLPALGFCSGAFGLFAMFLPPQFPPLLRTTGAGFVYNSGRLAAAVGVVILGFLPEANRRAVLLTAGGLFLAAAILAVRLPDSPPEPEYR